VQKLHHDIHIFFKHRLNRTTQQTRNRNARRLWYNFPSSNSFPPAVIHHHSSLHQPTCYHLSLETPGNGPLCSSSSRISDVRRSAIRVGNSARESNHRVEQIGGALVASTCVGNRLLRGLTLRDRSIISTADVRQSIA
jgi:hypothetical protein